MPQIHLPLDKIKKCQVCGGGGKLRLCSRCAERAYCSVECQKRDWKEHKPSCKTDRIDLTSYYPVLACMAELAHMSVSEGHPALRHNLIDSPKSGLLPDGSTAFIVKLGTPINEGDSDRDDWWPTAQTQAVRNRMRRRIAREGNVVPIVTSVCIALMLGIYATTTKDGTEEQHRIRLRFGSSPISDFGIVSGSVRVSPEDQLAYLFPHKEVVKIQEPQDHYWIYFMTHKGEELLLECNMFVFDMCLMVHGFQYFDESFHGGFPEAVPAWFRNSATTPKVEDNLTERSRFSVLRDESLLKALEPVDYDNRRNLIISDDSVKTITTFMSRVAGRAITHVEREVCMFGCSLGAYMIRETIRTGKWKSYPAPPKVAFEGPPAGADL
ncbi:hypothetical protein JB92DRAFT_2717112 [Gautieria morchelliformis]|nr:hypothetical protein JB92DRAFT_2717112 [Gautieria morchelliformis]